MQLFNASSLINEESIGEILTVMDQPEVLRERIIAIKQGLLSAYQFEAHGIPEDFTTSSYIIATNHLTDSDAPLIMSYYYQIMSQVRDTYPALFVFAKENCFNGVSIPKGLIPILDHESVFAVDRNSASGAMAAMKAAGKWFVQGEKPKHFLIFAQGTIYDVNQEQPQDIERGAFWLSKLLEVPVLPAFIEQAVERQLNRLVFGQPIVVPKGCRNFDPYRKLWLERVIAAQDSLAALTGTPARKAVLDEAHQTRKRFAQQEKG